MAANIDLHALRQDHWTESEFNNAKLVVDFAQHIMNEHDFDYVEKTFGSHRYRQHNHSMHDGVAGVVRAMRDVTTRFPGFQYDVRHILASGDMVLLHSHAVVRDQDRGNVKAGLIIMDRWQVVDGEIVGHWDAVQPLSLFFRFYAWISGRRIRNTNPIA